MDREHKAATKTLLWIAAILAMACIPLLNLYLMPFFAMAGVAVIVYSVVMPWLRKNHPQEEPSIQTKQMDPEVAKILAGLQDEESSMQK